MTAPSDNGAGTEPPQPGEEVEPVAADQTAGVTFTLLADVVDVLKDHGIGWADDDPSRKADAFVALVKLADAVAGAHRAEGEQ